MVRVKIRVRVISVNKLRNCSNVLLGLGLELKTLKFAVQVLIYLKFFKSFNYSIKLK